MKIIVLDDDPTGIQTVHDIYVYTDWHLETIRKAFQDANNLFFILTNSRSFSEEKTIQVHQEIGEKIKQVAQESGKEYIVISRGDSTLRGHYPFETETLRDALEGDDISYDGEIFCPFFLEGGRITEHGIHYIQEDGQRLPVAESEFAKDKTFGYEASELGAFIEEKTKGRYPASTCTYIDVELLRAKNIETIFNTLRQVHSFNKVIVDATNYHELQTFMTAFTRALKSGKRFIVRSAAGFPKVLGNISDQKLLTRTDLIDDNLESGGLVLIGSHVNKTTEQLIALKASKLDLDYIEFNADRVKVEGGLRSEVDRIIQKVEKNIVQKKTTVVYTSRKPVELETHNREEILKASVEISDAVTSIVGRLSIKPSFILAKGGITSSDVGTKALQVKKALVMGQVKPGVPVWKTDPESKFPNMPYIIFPGNVGERETLKEIIETII